ncbi:hypothetical protein [Allonocardiopsis opalescens]|uniref:DUF4352 domain-containing protein n=1 Tax=Allonocardiopsis opalescens TaxID=1144618 RepID=A0A2T0Q304_9ACTN|nr:hypothetical protein [Allonocardiopsis opalescens]PRX98174.1 hypothetical protein CLV72_105528 [Allonocardiopsis opalescens]
MPAGRTRGALLAVLLALAAAGCAAPTPPGTRAPAVPPPAAGPAAEPGGGAAPDDAHRYPDGVVVEVSAARVETISEVAAGGVPGEPMAAVDVTVDNGSDSEINIAIALVSAVTGDDATATDNVFDVDVLGDPLDGPIAAGETATGGYGFHLGDGDYSDLLIEVVLEPDREAAVFERSA